LSSSTPPLLQSQTKSIVQGVWITARLLPRQESRGDGEGRRGCQHFPGAMPGQVSRRSHVKVNVVDVESLPGQCCKSQRSFRLSRFPEGSTGIPPGSSTSWTEESVETGLQRNTGAQAGPGTVETVPSRRLHCLSIGQARVGQGRLRAGVCRNSRQAGVGQDGLQRTSECNQESAMAGFKEGKTHKPKGPSGRSWLSQRESGRTTNLQRLSAQVWSSDARMA
jgi:hypothetical protein